MSLAAGLLSTSGVGLVAAGRRFFPHLWGLSWPAGLAHVGLAVNPVVPLSRGMGVGTLAEASPACKGFTP